MPLPSELIIVPGHAAFKDSITEVPDQPSDNKWWVLQSFQQGEAPYYIEHIKKGVALWRAAPESMLMFTGGRTREEAGHWSEAATYRAIAQKLFDLPASDPRVTLEEYARDSFENVYFSRLKFYQICGRYPQKVTAVGWKFKEPRFTFHARTLGMDEQHFTYVGCNNPADLAGAERSEATTLEEFKRDPWGKEEPLATKRQARNPFKEVPPYKEP